VDAVDTVAAKLALIMEADRRGIPIISVMGAGNKRDPQRFCTGDIYSTQNCPLCRVMRRELRKRGIASLRAVFSDEEPAARHNPPGSLSFVPPVAGMLAAGEVINRLTGAI
jgi:tRNA A37 threonylcarbamoyladenosine dehydratase